MRNSKLIKRAFRKNLATSVISIAVTGINSMLDGLLMGNLIGPKALSAINLAMPVNYVLLTVESIFAAGAAILASKGTSIRSAMILATSLRVKGDSTYEEMMLI